MLIFALLTYFCVVAHLYFVLLCFKWQIVPYNAVANFRYLYCCCRTSGVPSCRPSSERMRTRMWKRVHIPPTTTPSRGQLPGSDNYLSHTSFPVGTRMQEGGTSRARTQNGAALWTSSDPGQSPTPRNSRNPPSLIKCPLLCRFVQLSLDSLNSTLLHI